MDYEAVIGLEVHAELATQSKMFCACPVIDPSASEPNVAVCPVCAGMPGVLPVVNRRAVEFALRVALALECEIAGTSIFARKNYFYPDLPKGYQISQYEQPLAANGRLRILTPDGERIIRIRRVHLEEDTGKLTHVVSQGQPASLVDLNRAGVPLLEIVSEPDLRSAADVRRYAMALRDLLRYLAVNSGDMQKGVMRVEPNVSVRPAGSHALGTRSEIKNLNSFRALERAVDYEVRRQVDLLRQGLPVALETRGWDEASGATVTQRVKEEADDYRYFPEPDLPPLVVDTSWITEVRASLPELPIARLDRFQEQYGLPAYDAQLLTSERAVADYFEAAVASAPVPAKAVANWIAGELFSLLNQAGIPIEECRVPPQALAELVAMVRDGVVNQNTAKSVLAEMFTTGSGAGEIVAGKGLRQVSEAGSIAGLVRLVLRENSPQVQSYLEGKESVKRWLVGQVMRQAGGQANPQLVQREVDAQLEQARRGAEDPDKNDLGLDEKRDSL